MPGLCGSPCGKPKSAGSWPRRRNSKATSRSQKARAITVAFSFSLLAGRYWLINVQRGFAAISSPQVKSILFSIKRPIYGTIREINMDSAPLSTEDALRHLQAQARYIFTPGEFAQLTGRVESGVAASSALKRLSGTGRITQALSRPTKWLIVPPEHAHYGAPPVSWWLDECLRDVEPHHYLALLSAARHWGSGHYARQSTQVMVSRPRLESAVGKLRLEYITKRNIQSTPVLTVNSQGGTLRVSTREATLLDLVRHNQEVGGMEAIARVAHDFRDETKPALLLAALQALDQASAAQRLGLVLEILGQTDAAQVLDDWLRARHRIKPLQIVPLERGALDSGLESRTRSKRWRVSYSPRQREELEELA